MCSLFEGLSAEAKSGLIGAFIGAIIPIAASAIAYCHISHKETVSAKGIAEQLTKDLKALIVDPAEWNFAEFKDRQLTSKSSVYMAEMAGTLIYKRLDSDQINKIEKTKRILYHYHNMTERYENERGDEPLDQWSDKMMPGRMKFLTNIIRNRAKKSLDMNP